MSAEIGKDITTGVSAAVFLSDQGFHHSPEKTGADNENHGRGDQQNNADDRWKIFKNWHIEKPATDRTR